MSTVVNVGSVNEFNAQSVIANLLVKFSSATAYERLVQEASFAKQSVNEIAVRTAGNLLKSSVTRKPNGCISTF